MGGRALSRERMRADFPRDDSYDPSTGGLVPGNGGSFEKCRRRWDLSTAEFLRYRCPSPPCTACGVVCHVMHVNALALTRRSCVGDIRSTAGDCAAS